MSRFTNSIY